MAKCDICGTSIPFGTNRCPNCGYRYKPERKLNLEQKTARKEAYMSQFQAHESPLDGLKNKKKIDFSKIYDDVVMKPQRNIKNVRRPMKPNLLFKIIRTMVVSIILMSLFTGFISIGIGYISEFINDVTEEHNNSYYETIGDEFINYSTYNDLAMNHTDIAEMVKPYYMYLVDKSCDSEEYLWQDFTVYNDELYSSYLSGAVNVNDYYITLSMYYDYDQWNETYIAFDDFEEGEMPTINEKVLYAFSAQTKIPYAELENVVEIHLDHLVIGENFNAIYELNNGYTLYLDYYETNLDYSLSRMFVLFD